MDLKKLLSGLYIVAKEILCLVISIDISSKLAKCPDIKITGFDFVILVINFFTN